MDVVPEVRPLPHGLNALIITKAAAALLDAGVVTLEQLLAAEVVDTGD